MEYLFFFKTILTHEFSHKRGLLKSNHLDVGFSSLMETNLKLNMNKKNVENQEND